LIFQDRSNTRGLTISGTSAANVTGVFYAPTANVSVSGTGTYTSQFIVGSLSVGGTSSSVNIVPPSSQANLVYLVE
jgi:hypothetical protein